MKLYMAVTADEYELPIAVTKTAGEMAICVRRLERDVLTMISRKTTSYDGYKILRIEVDDEN